MLKVNKTESFSNKTISIQASTNYDNLAIKLLNLDEGVFSATITNLVGEVLSIRYKPTAEPLKRSKEMLDNAGSQIAVVAALVQQAEVPYGDCKYIIFGYGRIKVAVIPIKRKRAILALGLDPNMETRELCLRALELGSQTSVDEE